MIMPPRYRRDRDATIPQFNQAKRLQRNLMQRDGSWHAVQKI